MRLSHSAIETLDQCPRRYQLTKIDQVRQAPGAALLVGTAIHAACEADSRSVIAGGERIAASALIDIAMAALDSERASADPDGLLDVSAMHRQVIATLATYAARVAPLLRPVAAETPFQFTVMDGVDFSGRIDLVTERDGVRTIVDFKSASKPWYSGVEHKKTQATAYLIAAERMEQPADRVTFITFPMRPDGSADLDCRTTTRTTDQRLAYERHIVSSAASIAFMRERQWFPANPGKLCAWCGVLGACTTGRDWLAAEGLTAQVPVLAE